MALWISDSIGRVLGPLAEAALRDLVTTGRLKRIASASRDGKAWRPVAEFPELCQLMVLPAPGARREQERAAAVRLRAELALMKGKSAHEVLKVARDASQSELRSAFFAQVRAYAPERLPKDVDPTLRQAFEDGFLFLAGLMVKAEERLAPAQPSAPPLTPRMPLRSDFSLTPVKPTYLSSEVIGFAPILGDRLQCTLKVNQQTAGMLFEHRLMNITNGGVFISWPESFPLGTQLEVVFAFEEEQRTIKATAKISFENRIDERQALGFGLRFVRVAPDDLAFLKEYAQRELAHRRSQAAARS